MTNRYQIKYAIMPILGYRQLDSGYGTVFNMVSKCYVVSEKYLTDGSSTMMYEVVFPYQEFDDFDLCERLEPMYDLNGNCNNSKIVSCVFDSYDDAQVVANVANNKILLDEIGLLPFDDNFDRSVSMLRSNNKVSLSRYRMLEQKVNDATSDMAISREPNIDLDTVLKKVIDSPSEFYIKLADSLTDEECFYLNQLIDGKKCDNCSNGLCDIDEDNKKLSVACSKWTNKEMIGKQLLLSIRH